MKLKQIIKKYWWLIIIGILLFIFIPNFVSSLEGYPAKIGMNVPSNPTEVVKGTVPLNFTVV